MITTHNGESLYTVFPFQVKEEYTHRIITIIIMIDTILNEFLFAVIDFCLTKCLYANSATQFTSLQLCWASKQSCIQRAGRAGRVMNGRVYRLVTKHFYHV